MGSWNAVTYPVILWKAKVIIVTPEYQMFTVIKGKIVRGV